MKATGTVMALSGFVLWFGGPFLMNPLVSAGIGLPVFIAGAAIYFIGRKHEPQ